MHETYANYAWIIDRDYTVDLANHDPRYNETTKRFDHTVPKRFETADEAGPRNGHPDAIADLKKGKGTAFALWDDDGIRYYSGRFFETLDGLGYGNVNPEDTNEEGPLGDYGRPNAGATEMTIRNGEGYVS